MNESFQRIKQFLKPKIFIELTFNILNAMLTQFITKNMKNRKRKKS